VFPIHRSETCEDKRRQWEEKKEKGELDADDPSPNEWILTAEQRVVVKAKRHAELEEQRKAAEMREVLVQFYEKHDPAKVEEVDYFLEKYAGRLDELVRQMKLKYGEAFVAAPEASDGKASREGIRQGKRSSGRQQNSGARGRG
jgi:hypothetical protein